MKVELRPALPGIGPGVSGPALDAVATEATRSDGSSGPLAVGFAPVALDRFGDVATEKDGAVSVLDAKVGGLAATAHTGVRLRDGLTAAASLAEAGRLEDARDLYLELINDGALPDRDRAVAALELAQVMRTWDRTGAEVFYLRAVALDAGVRGAKRLQMQLLVDRGEYRRAMPVIDDILAEAPLDIDVLRTRAELLLEEGEAKDGLAVARRAHALAIELAPDQVRATAFTLSTAYKRNAQYPEAVEICRGLLANNPEDTEAHRAIAEYVNPDFVGPHRPAINALFAEATECYQEGQFHRAAAVALEILALDADDGLAHTLFCLAKDAETTAAWEQQAGGPALLSQLATARQRHALIEHLSALTARARVGETSRPGSPRDLFPEWDELTITQQATVAFSVLGFGELLPELIEAGACYRFAMVGTSCTEIDTDMEVTAANAWGRHMYAVRGWQRGLFSVTGVEKIEDAARGRYNTITHEFAHIVHRYAMGLAQADAASTAARPSREALVALAEAIPALYDQALAGEDGQVLLDAYSGNDVLEYFAQAMMSYLNPLPSQGLESATRLFDRNPHMFERVREFTERFRSFPPEVPGVDHPRVGQAASGTPGTLARLAVRGQTPETRAAARLTLESLESLYNPGAPDITHHELPEMSVQQYWSLLLQRAGELARVDAGELPPGTLGDPEAMLAAMGPEDLACHLTAMRRRAAMDGDAGGMSATLEIIATALGRGRLDEARARFLELARGMRLSS